MRLDRNNCSEIYGAFELIPSARFAMGDHYFDARGKYLGSLVNGKVEFLAEQPKASHKPQEKQKDFQFDSSRELRKFHEAPLWGSTIP